jgi:hypothetical protein
MAKGPQISRCNKSNLEVAIEVQRVKGKHFCLAK